MALVTSEPFRDKCLFCLLSCLCLSTSETQASKGHPHQSSLCLGYSGNENVSSWWDWVQVLFSSLHPLISLSRAARSHAHWITGCHQGADCFCRCSAWATPSIPYSHIFDSVNLVCCFFFQLCLHHTPESFAFFFLLFFFSFRRYSHNCHKSLIKWIDLWRRGILEHFLPWLLWSLWYYLHLYPSWDIIVWMAGQLRWVKNSLNDQVCRVFVRGH